MIFDNVLKKLSKEELEQLWWENERERCQKDLLYLCREYLGYNDLNDDLHGPIADRLMEWKDFAVFLPRGHLKTSLISVGKTIQLILNNQNIRIKIVSYAYSKAAEIVTEIEGHLKNEKLIALFPEILYENPFAESDRWRENSFNVKRTRVVQGFTVEALGILTGNVGKHCDVIIFDDVHDDKNTATQELIQKVDDRVRLFLSVLDPGGLRLYAGTRWKKEDVYGRLIKTIEHIRREDIEPIGDPDGKPIFPEKFTLEELAKVKAELGTHFYYLQYKNRVHDEEDIVFKEKWFQWWKGMDRQWARVYILMDPAITLSKKSCDTVIQTICQTDENHFFVKRSYGFKARVQEIVDQLFLEIMRYIDRYEVRVGIEKVAYQEALIQWVEKDQSAYNVYFEVHALEPHGRRKEYRIRRLAPMFERKQIWLHESCDELHQQLLDFGGTTKVDHADTLAYLPDIIVSEGVYDVRPMKEFPDDPWSLDAVIEEEAELSYLDF